MHDLKNELFIKKPPKKMSIKIDTYTLLISNNAKYFTFVNKNSLFY